MIYLKKFTLMDEDATYHNGWDRIISQHTQDEYYPKGLFSQKIREITFDHITIFYGGNGSGKSTLLNLIAETLDIQRLEKYNRTKMFDFFVQHNLYELEDSYILKKSKLIASDDIFKHILNVREENNKIRNKKIDEAYFSDQVKSSSYSDYWEGGVHLDMEDRDGVDAFMKFMEGRSKSKRRFVRDRAGELHRQFSNGENALIYFDKEIEENAIYLLDEPENSMSPQFQLQLKTLIEDSVYLKKCQFVIATHSPFVLALQNARIYNLDTEPATVEKWHQLENMRIYYDFFKLFKYNFESITNKTDSL